MKSSLPLRVESTKQNVRYYCTYLNKQPKWELRRPGIEPGSTAWKAAMLTTIPPTLHMKEAIP